jgi:hypothetical protein
MTQALHPKLAGPDYPASFLSGIKTQLAPDSVLEESKWVK